MSETQSAQRERSLDEFDEFPPTVCEHTVYHDAIRLETIDSDADSDIIVDR